MTDAKNDYFQWDYPEKRCSLHIEEDHSVMHAYMVKDKSIISSVWLYNLADAPQFPLWKIDKGHNAPYLNPISYLSVRQFVPDDPENQLKVIDSVSPDNFLQIEIAYFSTAKESSVVLLAVLREGTKIGWSRNARIDGPIAKSLDEALKNGLFVSDYWSSSGYGR